MSRFTVFGVATIICALAEPAHAAGFTIWNSFTSTSVSGTIADPNGPVTVNLSITNSTGPDQIFGIENSSSFGSFFGSKTVADIYEPNPPGTSDFFTAVAGSNTAVYTLTFSRAVVDPVFHVYNLDFRNYNFLGGLTPVVLSGLNLVASGSSVGDVDGGLSFDNGGLSDPNKGNPSGSAYGSFMLNGTFSSISWNRPLTPGAFFTDGNLLGVSVMRTVPEPFTILGAGTALGFGTYFKRQLSKKKK